MHPTGNDDASSYGGWPFTPNSKESVLISLWLTLNFIDIGWNASRQNIFIDPQCILR